MSIRTLFISLSIALSLTGCTGDTPSTSDTEGMVDSEGSSGSTTEALTSTDGTSGSSTSTTSTSTTTSTTGAPSETTGDNTTGWVDACMEDCEVYLTRAQAADDLGTVCEKLFSEMLCTDGGEDDYLSRAEATKVVYQYLLDQGTFPEDCMGTIPNHLDVPRAAWFYPPIWKLYCAEVLYDDGQQCSTNFCPGSSACHDWWKEILMRMNML